MLISTLGGRFPRVADELRGQQTVFDGASNRKGSSMGRVSAVPVPGRRVLSLPTLNAGSHLGLSSRLLKKSLTPNFSG